MKGSLRKFGWVLSLILFTIIILSTMGVINKKGRREIKVAKSFLESLDQKDILKAKELKNLELDKTNLSGEDINLNSVVSNRLYSLEINNNLEVITFVSHDYKGETKISLEEGIEKAKKYISEIGEDKYRFIEAIESTLKDDKVPYYSLKFEKLKDGYVYYGAEVILNIDKGDGSLVGYTNRLGKVETVRPYIDVNKEQAERIAKYDLEVLNEKVEILGETYLAYYKIDDSTEKAELDYVVELGSENSKKEPEKYLYFVGANDGEIINKIKVIDETSFEKKKQD